MNKVQKRQRLIRAYKQATGTTDVDMKEVAKYALRNGWRMPVPVDPLDRMAAQFAHAARVETRYDDVTKQPYRVNHAIPFRRPDGKQGYLWVDIDDESTSRWKMAKALNVYREQMVGEGVHVQNTVNHWNRIHQGEEPIQLDLDLTDDVAWRLNSDDKDDKGKKAS